MIVIFFVLEDKIKRAKSKAEEEVLVKEARRIYFPPERRRREKIERIEYPEELMKYYLDKERFMSDLKEIGMNYYTLSKDIGMKTHAIRRDERGDYIPLLDKHYEKIREVSGLDIESYILSTEPAFRQPQRPINVDPIKKALENKGIQRHQLSLDLYNSSGALNTYIKKETMPLHKTKELCDVLGLGHSEVIVEEMEE